MLEQDLGEIRQRQNVLRDAIDRKLQYTPWRKSEHWIIIINSSL